MRLADAFARVIGEGPQVRFEAYDGSRAGPPGAEVTIAVRSPKALRYVVRSPRGLGLARAYVAGEIDVVGDIYTGLREMSRNSTGDLSWPERLGVLRAIGLGDRKSVV